jgi:hypothetical protein
MKLPAASANGQGIKDNYNLIYIGGNLVSPTPLY